MNANVLPLLPIEIRERYQALQAKLWMPGEPLRPNLSPGVTIPTIVPDQNLTASEFSFIVESVAQYKLMTTIISAEMGFGFNVMVYAHPETGETKPTHLVSFASKQVPNNAIEGLSDKLGDDRKKAVMAYFDPIARSEENLAFLRFYKLGTPATWKECEY